MAEFIISLGTIKKVFIVPIIYMLLYSSIHIYHHYYHKNLVASFIEQFGSSFGTFLNFFTSNFIKYRRKINKKSKNTIKNYPKDYGILFLIVLVYSMSEWLSYIVQNYEQKNKEDSPLSRGLYINDAIEIIFLILVTTFILKYKYYIHHFISIAIFIILCIFIDIILKNFSNPKTLIIIDSILYVIVDSIYFSYLKYLFTNKYYFYLDVVFALGLIEIFNTFLSLSICAIIDKNKLIFEFYSFYDEYGIGHIITRFLIFMILYGFFIVFATIIILNNLEPDFIAVSYVFSKIPITILETEGSMKKWLIILISIFQIIFLLFYLEIFEYNFCSLNRNTKKNIIKREISETNQTHKNEILLKIDMKEQEMDEIYN